jgi:hypothetical protein
MENCGDEENFNIRKIKMERRVYRNRNEAIIRKSTINMGEIIIVENEK